MLTNYIKIAWRNLSRHKSYTSLNLTGLAVGMACCILITLYVKEELSFDTFHEHSEQIIAVGGESQYFGRMLSTPYPLGDALEQEIPQVAQAVRFKGAGQVLLSPDGQNYTELKDGHYTDSRVFTIFSFDLVAGNKDEVLKSPGSIVLTQRGAEQLFGRQNPVGQSLFWQKRDTMVTLQVTGIIEAPPANSTIKFEALISENTLPESQRKPDAWTSYSYRTYALLQKPEASDAMEMQLQLLVENHYEANDQGEYTHGFFMLPLTDLHLSEETRDEGFTGNRAYLYLFGSVALFILVIACVNYVNLATARSSIREKEVGIRKALGAVRLQVAGQFIGESVILCAGAFVLGSLLAMGALPYFNQLFGTSLEWQANGTLLVALSGVAVFIGIIAGLYPSLYLSRFSPSAVLRNQGKQGGSGAFLRQVLVVGQFAIALVLIIGALVIFKQLQYTQTKDLGFNGEQVVSVTLPNMEAWNRRDLIRNNLAGVTGIKQLSLASGSPGRFNIRMGHTPEKISPEAEVGDDIENLMFAPAVVDYNFLDLLDIELVAGRNFSREMGSDIDRAFIINRKTAEMLGWTPEEAIGKSFNLSDEGEIIGVTEDFHISSLHEEIEAVVLQLSQSSSWYTDGAILAKLEPGQIRQVMDTIEEEVKRFSAHAPFNYEFLDERFDAMYRTERRLGNIVALFTGIAIIIACFGLYGLAAFSAEKRIKEIGIRKVLGATVPNIISLLSKDFLKLVLLGFVISVPIAWYFMNRWLQDFAYRIEMGVGIFLTAGIGAVVIALATISWQSIRAATANPADSLKSE